MHEPIQQLMRRAFKRVELLGLVLKAQLTATGLQWSTDLAPGQTEPVRGSVPARALAINSAKRQTIKSTLQGPLLPSSAAVGSEKRQKSFPGRAGQRHTVELSQACPSSSPWPSLRRELPSPGPFQGPGRVAELASLARAESLAAH